jgi:hypothetical protein
MPQLVTYKGRIEPVSCPHGSVASCGWNRHEHANGGAHRDCAVFGLRPPQLAASFICLRQPETPAATLLSGPHQ